MTAKIAVVIVASTLILPCLMASGYMGNDGAQWLDSWVCIETYLIIFVDNSAGSLILTVEACQDKRGLYPKSGTDSAGVKEAVRSTLYSPRKASRPRQT